MSNKITAIGRLTRPAEVRFTASGVTVASFSIAWNDRRKSAAGEWEDGDSHFLDVSAWRNLADRCGDLDKGQRVVVVGELKSRQWEDREGVKRTAWQVDAEEVGMLLDKFARTPTARTASNANSDPWANQSDDAPIRNNRQEQP